MLNIDKLLEVPSVSTEALRDDLNALPSSFLTSVFLENCADGVALPSEIIVVPYNGGLRATVCFPQEQEDRPAWVAVHLLIQLVRRRIAQSDPHGRNILVWVDWGLPTTSPNDAAYA